MNIIGEQAERIYIAFSHDRLATMGLSPQDIFNALNSQNAPPRRAPLRPGRADFYPPDGAFDELQKIRDTPLVAGAKRSRCRMWQRLNEAMKIPDDADTQSA